MPPLAEQDFKDLSTRLKENPVLNTAGLPKEKVYAPIRAKIDELGIEGLELRTFAAIWYFEDYNPEGATKEDLIAILGVEPAHF